MGLAGVKVKGGGGGANEARMSGKVSQVVNVPLPQCQVQVEAMPGPQPTPVSFPFL